MSVETGPFIYKLVPKTASRKFLAQVPEGLAVWFMRSLWVPADLGLVDGPDGLVELKSQL